MPGAVPSATRSTYGQQQPLKDSARLTEFNGWGGQRLGVLRYTVPNGFTALSLLLGVASIITAQLGDLELAGWIIVWCGLLDVMDGVSARYIPSV